MICIIIGHTDVHRGLDAWENLTDIIQGERSKNIKVAIYKENVQRHSYRKIYLYQTPFGYRRKSGWKCTNSVKWSHLGNFKNIHKQYILYLGSTNSELQQSECVLQGGYHLVMSVVVGGNR